MNVYEREYFVSRVRSGYYHIKDGNVKIKVLPPTPEDEFLASELFMEVLDGLKDSNVKSEEEMIEWMKDNGLWSEKDELEIKKCTKKLDEIKLKMYRERHTQQVVDGGRDAIKIVKKALRDLRARKEEYNNSTKEGIAFNDKSLFLFERCCYIGNDRFDFSSIDSHPYYYAWLKQILREEQIREIARNDPWRHFWMLKEQSEVFHKHEGRDLNPDQKNLVVWSKMYDNVYESPESPSPDVIEDDDLLDGWFIHQRKKIEEGSSEDGGISERISNNPRTAGAQEVAIVANNKKDIENINKLNSPVALRNKHDRINTVKARGTATDLDFTDKKMELRTQSNQMFKNNFRR